jgi:integrase
VKWSITGPRSLSKADGPLTTSALGFAGLDPDKVVRHTLRHTAATHIVQAGVDLPTAAFFTGHKSLEMLRRYVHASTPQVRGALDKLEARYRQADDKTDRECEMPRPPSYAAERRRGVRRLREQATD